MKEYLDSLSKPGNYLSGNPELLPKDLKEKHLQFTALEKAFFEGERFNRKEDRAPYSEALKDARKEYYTDLMKACETYLNNKEINHQLNSDMKKKQTNESETKETKMNKSETKEKREPQLVTVNGDQITHAHAFKSNKSDDWFFTAKINGVPMKAQLMDNNDVGKVLEKSASTKEMMEKYYPSALLPKVSPAEFKLPRPIQTVNGEEQIIKFNVYKENRADNPSYGKYKLYAQVGEKKMSVDASKQDLDAYFNRVATPTQLIAKNFGDRLGMAAHYEQFKLPEGMNIEGKNIRLAKNKETNRYEISVRTSDGLSTPAKEISYDDRQSFFQNKVASKEQLAAKYLSKELTTLSMTQKPKVEKQMSMGI